MLLLSLKIINGNHLAFVCDGGKWTIYVNGNIDATLDLPRKLFASC